MRTFFPILALAIYFTSALARYDEGFYCITPPPHCCDVLTTSGIGMNCTAATTVTVQKQKTNGAPVTNPAFQPKEYMSLCHSPMKSACCKTNATSMTSTMEISECTPPEEVMYQLDTETGEMTSPFYDDDEDDEEDY